MIITFSGLDGSGKTTLINKLTDYLEDENIIFDSKSIYEDLSHYAIIRSFLKLLKAKDNYLKTDQSLLIDKNEKKIFYRLFRSSFIKKIFLFLDIFLLHLVIFCYRHKCKTLIIDRYFYDYLMEVTQQIGFYQRVICYLFPAVDISFYIHVDPEVAFSRKGEYSVDILTKRKKVYDSIFKIRKIDYMIANNNQEDAWLDIKKIVSKKFKI